MIKSKYLKILETIEKIDDIKHHIFSNFDINDILFNSKIKGKFNGCFMHDLYEPNIKPYTIINIDNSSKMGTHWLGVFQDDKILYVYDSFARKNILRTFKKRMMSKGYKVVLCNDQKDQKISEVDCGLRCLIWLLFINKYGFEKCKNI